MPQDDVQLEDSAQLALFAIDERTYALPLEVMREVVHAVEIAPLPGAPAVVVGLVDLRGEIVPVFDLRACFDHPRRELRISDHFAIVRIGARTVALWVDQVLEVQAVARAEIAAAEGLTRGGRAVRGVLSLPGGLCLIAEPGEFLSEAETLALDSALAGDGA